jgi:dihydroorotate dehydrogenase electron transfer subunit
MNRMKQFISKITQQRSIATDYFEMRFSWLPDFETPAPGQFLNLRCTDKTTPLLRRPFAFSGFDKTKNEASVIYQLRGPGTGILSQKKTGDSIDIIAPLGTGFRASERNRIHIIVSGGIGFGPLWFLSRTLKDGGYRFIFIHGAKTKKFIPDFTCFESPEFIVCTDDGSLGYRGTTTGYLSTIDNETIANAALYACGPLPMLEACSGLSEKHGIECFVSMEQIMACGFGACMGCVIKTKTGTGFARVCKEGPVFPAKDIVWNSR